MILRWQKNKQIPRKVLQEADTQATQDAESY
jgi:hypothetical protein